ncbi:unnamed protein product [Spirodela intermedia]|uniref:Bifunctional inhibitor/plant lipid transfer protein/seed storage helical domain-containing protein n=1 Tax=Spirodela intermedia TaxID=51605 RepID=A0A7I8KRB8_SPIIN|nr:unnamed protein product [Spirodela intermedia]
MTSKSQVTSAFLILNLFIWTLVSSQPTLTPPPPPPSLLGCVFNILSLAVCTPILFLLKVFGVAPNDGPCCDLIKSASSTGAVSCLCLGIRINLFGFNITVPGDIKLLLNLCNMTVPIGIGCP